MPISQIRHSGASLVSMMLATALMALAIGGALNTYTFLVGKESAAKQDETYNKAVRIGEIVSARISRGGAYAPDRNNNAVLYGGIRVCTLDSASNSCGSYNRQSNRTCLALPTKVGYGALASYEMKGVRLVNQRLQQKSLNDLDDQDLRTFNVGAFCRGNTGWTDLHSSNDMITSEFSVCAFQANNMNDLKIDYSSNCPSIVSNNKNAKKLWMMVMKVNRAGIQTTPVQYAKIIPILNATEVISP